jgi:hypothetical protein
MTAAIRRSLQASLLVQEEVGRHQPALDRIHRQSQLLEDSETQEYRVVDFALAVARLPRRARPEGAAP